MADAGFGVDEETDGKSLPSTSAPITATTR
jgi:hypothetical protein